MATAWQSNMATHYQNKTVYAAATTSFVAWLDMDPQNSNWWWMEIGVPRIVARTLLLLNNTSLLPKAAPLLDRATIHRALGMTGCNTVWVASANVLRAAFEGNRTLMQQAFDAIHGTYKVNKRRHQRDAHGSIADASRLISSSRFTPFPLAWKSVG